ncbi:cuticle protein 16.5-like [Topomyia yanbarensis]|uniref:cuticle protein 16.5-like n=1 Tax=Topomyia yanbarensis TaxID=2498891 RepID=UPI00273B5179|nr:cuticle protein 16.5-like [Topomyia yanbarensis]
MFKLVVLSAVLAVAAAAPSATVYASAPLAYTSVVHQPTIYAQKEISYQKSIIEEPTVAHVGTVLKNVPTGVSHHSSSVVHHDAKISEPIYAPTVKKTVVSTPIEKTTYHQTYAAAPAITYAAAPIAKHAYVEAAPALTYAAAPAYTYAAAPALSYAASPALTYAASPISYHGSYYGAAPAVYAHH